MTDYFDRLEAELVRAGYTERRRARPARWAAPPAVAAAIVVAVLLAPAGAPKRELPLPSATRNGLKAAVPAYLIDPLPGPPPLKRPVLVYYAENAPTAGRTFASRLRAAGWPVRLRQAPDDVLLYPTVLAARPGHLPEGRRVARRLGFSRVGAGGQAPLPVYFLPGPDLIRPLAVTVAGRPLQPLPAGNSVPFRRADRYRLTITTGDDAVHGTVRVTVRGATSDIAVGRAGVDAPAHATRYVEVRVERLPSAGEVYDIRVDAPGMHARYAVLFED